MSGSSNFQQFNPAKNNQMTDSEYASDTNRADGVVSGPASSSSFNKFCYQVSTFIAAFGAMLATKGFAVSDASMSALEAVLADVVTTADYTAADVLEKMVSVSSTTNGVTVQAAGSAATAGTATTATTATNVSGTGTGIRSSEPGLRVVRGSIATDGSVVSGSGFTVTGPANGVAGYNHVYTLTFSPAFSSTPTVVMTGMLIPGGAQIGVISQTASGAQVASATGFNGDNGFTFIAVGPN